MKEKVEKLTELVEGNKLNEIKNKKIKIPRKAKVRKRKTRKRFLKKPVAKPIKKINVTKILMELASQQGPLVKEPEQKQKIIANTTSLFFDSELSKEKRNWLV